MELAHEMESAHEIELAHEMASSLLEGADINNCCVVENTGQTSFETPMEVDTSTTTEIMSSEATHCEFQSTEEFLNCIYDKFLDIVNPKETGLLDELRRLDAISSDQEEEVQAEKTRRDKARTLWKNLHSIPPQMFAEHCVPVLQKMFPQVVPKARFSRLQDDETCIQNIIVKRIMPKRLADIFPSSKCCSFDEIREIIDSKDNRTELWKRVFALIRKYSSNRSLQENLQKVLRGIGIKDHLKLLTCLQNESHCSCGQADQPLQVQETSNRSPELHHPTSDPDDTASTSTIYPCSGTSSNRSMPTSVNSSEIGELESRSMPTSVNSSEIRELASQSMPTSENSSEIWELAVQSMPTSENSSEIRELASQSMLTSVNSSEIRELASQSMPTSENSSEIGELASQSLETRQTAVSFLGCKDKAEYRKTLLKVNSALARVSYIRVLHRELEGIGDEIHLILERDDNETDISRNTINPEPLMPYLGKAYIKRNRIQQLYFSIKATVSMQESVQFEIPETHRKRLLWRQNLLQKEVKEAFFFYSHANRMCNLLEKYVNMSDYSLRRFT